MIDIAAVASRILSQSRSLLPAWFPEGRFQGHEFLVGSLRGERGTSLSINWTTGRWADFAAGDKGGDLVSLYAAANGVSQVDAARVLGDSAPSTAEPSRQKKERKIIVPVPDTAPLCVCFHYKHGKASRIWTYKDQAGRLLGHIARYDVDGGKEIIPWTFALEAKGTKWGMGQWPAPRPLYGLDLLALRRDDPVLIVEGEKAADAARELALSYAVVTSPGGSKAWRKADWSALKGKSVLLWPDHDDAGIQMMWELGHELIKICPQVKVIIPSDVPEGWDAADAQGDGWTWTQVKEWAIPRLKQINEGGQYENQNAANAGVAQDGSAASEDHGDRAVRDRKSDGNRGAPEGSGSSHENNSALNATSEGRPDGGANSAGPGANARNKAGNDSSVESRRIVSASEERSGGVGSEVQGVKAGQRIIEWEKLALDRNGNGYPLSNLNNAVHVLEAMSPDSIWFDEFLQRFMTTGGDGRPREWADVDDTKLALEMQRVVGIRTMATRTASEAVQVVAMKNLRNCVRDWLDSLKWDGEPRISHFFEDHFGAEATPYTTAVSKNFWLSMVARIYSPGCKMDNTIVLEGDQGVGKSSAVAAIGGDWYMEQKEDIDDKDFYQVIQGRWVIEISEMHSFNRAEMSGVKRTISSMTDRYRASYARHPADHPRQCVFICTTNHYDWNKDETGARRFWPIRCNGPVDVDEIKARRMDLFAEAVALFKAAGECKACLDRSGRRCDAHDWWTVPIEATLEQQRRRYDADPWIEAIQDFVELKSDVRTMEILTECLKLEIGRVGRSDHMRVATCLKFLGWERQNTRVGHSVVKSWSRRDEH